MSPAGHFSLRSLVNKIRNQAIALPLLIGFSITLFAALLCFHWQTNALSIRLARDTTAIAAAIETQIKIGMQQTDAIASLYAASREVERDEFQAFVRPFLLQNPTMRAFDWIPRVVHENRKEFELQASTDWASDFHIVERDTSNDLIEASVRTEYFPVRFLEPYQGNESALGYDLGSSATRLKTLMLARDTNQAILTAPIRFLQADDGEQGFLGVKPIYTKDVNIQNLESRQNSLLGFAVSVFEINNLFQFALKNFTHLPLHIKVIDATDPTHLHLIYQARLGKKLEPLATESVNLWGLEHLVKRPSAISTTIGGRQWVTLCDPLPGYSPAWESLFPWFLGLLGFVTTMILTGISFKSGTSAATWHQQKKKKIMTPSPLQTIAQPLLNSIFSPSTALMHRLKYPQKFLLISTLFFLPLSFSLFHLISEFNNRIEFTQKELYGTVYLRPIRALLQETIHTRTLVRFSAAEGVQGRPDITRAYVAINQKLAAMEPVDRAYSTVLGTSNQLHALIRDWEFIESLGFKANPKDMDELFKKFIAEIRTLITHVGNTSNLILDPDLDTYYLMDAVLLKLPDNQDRLGTLHIVGKSALQQPQFPDEDRAEIFYLKGIIDHNYRETLKGFEIAFQNTASKTLQSALQPFIEKRNTIFENTLRTIKENILLKSQPTLSEEEFVRILGETLNASFGLWNQTVAQLDILLQRRAGDLIEKRNIILGFCAVMLVLVGYFWVAFYRSVMRTVSYLEGSIQRMIKGEGEGEGKQLVTYDELGRVADSFQSIARKLRDERDQAKEETKRATLAEQKIRESTKRIQTLMKATNDAVWDWNLQTNYVEWNEGLCQLYGYPPEAIKNDPQWWKDRIHPEDREEVLKSVDAAIHSGERYWSAEYRFRRFDGTYAYTYDRGYLILDANQRPVQIIGAMMDISKQKKLEHQLLQSQKLETVGTLASGIAHDLNNQLTPIHGYLDLLTYQVDVKNPIHPLLVEVKQAAVRCADIVQKLINFSRPSLQTKNDVKFEKIFKELSPLLEKFLPKTIHVRMTCDPKLNSIFANETELESVLINLAANARDAMPQGGTLSFEASSVDLTQDKVKQAFKPGHYALLNIRDTGSGIPSDILTRIFEPFFTTKEKGKGTGLGLSMVFNIIKDHGGWIDVSSTVGKGTCFQIYLPLGIRPPDLKANPSVQTDNELKQRASLPRGHETILFADDEDYMRKMGQAFLERLGYKIILAQDGLETVELFQQHHHQIAAVVLDMTMPKQMGLETFSALRMIDPHVKILAVSGYTSEGTPDELMDAGAGAFLKKPYTIFPLAQTLRKIIDNGTHAAAA